MKLLCIGNSFSVDACSYMTSIAEAGGLELTTVNLVIGGCSLERHCSNIGMNDDAHLYSKSIDALSVGKISLDEALAEDTYDVVSIQQASHFSGVWETYDPYLMVLVDHVRRFQPNAKLAIHQTWAYEQDSPHSGFKTYESNRHLMHASLTECYERAAKLSGADFIVRCGDLIATLRDSWRFDPEKFGSRLTRDGFHLSYEYGRYAAGLMWCSTLGMENVEDNSFRPPFLGVSEEKLAFIRRTVKELVG